MRKFICLITYFINSPLTFCYKCTFICKGKTPLINIYKIQNMQQPTRFDNKM